MKEKPTNIREMQPQLIRRHIEIDKLNAKAKIELLRARILRNKAKAQMAYDELMNKLITIDVAVKKLTTQYRESNKDDWKGIDRCMEYELKEMAKKMHSAYSKLNFIKLVIQFIR